jgi:hypothetical protein
VQLTAEPPYSHVEPVTEVLRGVPITDPYRWLEDQGPTRTREWLAAQTQHVRVHLDANPGRERTRTRISELLDLKVGGDFGYFFHDRLPTEVQFSTFLRDGQKREIHLSFR